MIENHGQRQYNGKFEGYGQGQCRDKVVGHGQGQCWDKDEGMGRGNDVKTRGRGIVILVSGIGYRILINLTDRISDIGYRIPDTG